MGFPTATFDYWRVVDLIWSLMLLRVTPPHRCNNCQRLQIDTDGWWSAREHRCHPIPSDPIARLGTFVATAGCDTLGSGSKCEGVQAFRVSPATWRLTKSQTSWVKPSQTWKNMQRVGSVEQNFAKVVIYHVISLCGWTLQYCCRMVSEWYTWSVWKDLMLKGFLLKLFWLGAVQDQDRDRWSLVVTSVGHLPGCLQQERHGGGGTMEPLGGEIEIGCEAVGPRYFYLWQAYFWWSMWPSEFASCHRLLMTKVRVAGYKWL